MNGANFYSTVVSQGNEIAFMKEIVSFITGLDEKITCNDDPDYEYDKDNRGETYVPRFRFYFNNEHIFTINRGANLNTGANGFTIQYIYDDAVFNSRWVHVHDSSVQSYLVVRKRWSYISYIISDNFILIDFHDVVPSWGDQYGIRIMYAKSGDDEYSAYDILRYSDNFTKECVFNISIALGGTGTPTGLVFRDLSSTKSGSFTSRFAYKSLPGQIDYIKSCVYLNGDQRQFDISAICDSTELQAIGDTVSLKDGAYLAVGLHQLVKVS